MLVRQCSASTSRAGRREAAESETGFDVLRTVSQNRNIPLRVIAADLVAKTVNPERFN